MIEEQRFDTQEDTYERVRHGAFVTTQTQDAEQAQNTAVADLHSDLADIKLGQDITKIRYFLLNAEYF